MRRRRETSLPSQPAALDIWMPEEADVIAIGVDGYLGVTASTETLFSDTIAPPADLAEIQVERLADQLIETGTRHFVVSGWSPSRLELVRQLAVRGVRVDAVWHGNYLQTWEDYGWEMFQGVIGAARMGDITTVGVVKAGMEVWLNGLGIKAALLLNYVPTVPEGPNAPEAGGPHLGLWLAGEGYRKLPYAMIAAAGMLDDVSLAGSGVSQRAVDFARFVGLETTRLLTGPLDHDLLLEAIKRTHLTMYVTQSECGPMLPLESMGQGVPCLIGPNSHIFADDDFLASTLIVPYPDHAEVIARYATNAIEKRAEIIDAYIAYAPGYIDRARRSVELFLS